MTWLGAGLCLLLLAPAADPAALDHYLGLRHSAEAALPGASRAVVVRLTVGAEERELHTLAAAVLEFCRTVPLGPAR